MFNPKNLIHSTWLQIQKQQCGKESITMEKQIRVCFVTRKVTNKLTADPGFDITNP
jgi:hypothetical protein